MKITLTVNCPDEKKAEEIIESLRFVSDVLNGDKIETEIAIENEML